MVGNQTWSLTTHGYDALQVDGPPTGFRKLSKGLPMKERSYVKQECIPVGCVPAAG